MDSLTCFIVDDNLDAIEIIENYIQQIPNLNLLGSCTSPLDFLAKLKEGLAPDLLFLDIEMPMINGIELARHLPMKAVIIYISAHVNYAYDAFEVNSADYLRKPFSLSRFITAVDKAFKMIELQNFQNQNRNSLSEPEIEASRRNLPQELKSKDYFFVFSKDTGHNDLRRFSEVIYIHALDTYVELYLTESRKNIFHRSMASLEEILPPHFIRVHRSYIINTQYIQSISVNKVHLREANLPIPIGSIFKENVTKFMEGRIIENIY